MWLSLCMSLRVSLHLCGYLHVSVPLCACLCVSFCLHVSLCVSVSCVCMCPLLCVSRNPKQSVCVYVDLCVGSERKGMYKHSLSKLLKGDTNKNKHSHLYRDSSELNFWRLFSKTLEKIHLKLNKESIWNNFLPVFLPKKTKNADFRPLEMDPAKYFFDMNSLLSFDALSKP